MSNTTKTFSFEEDGGNLKFTVAVDTKGSATITVTEGSADFNAIYWDTGGDGDAGRGGPLNMNGAGSRDAQGNAIDWNGAQALSNPGLGNGRSGGRGNQRDDTLEDDLFENGDKKTFLEEGDTQKFNLAEDFDFSNLTNIGIRATSVNGDGSIKAVSDEADEGKVDGHEEGGPKVEDDPEDKGSDKETGSPKDKGDHQDQKEPEGKDGDKIEKDPKKADGDKDSGNDKDDDSLEWPQDISNVVFYFDTGGKEGEADYSVKVDNFDEGEFISNDLGDYYDAMLAFVDENAPDDKLEEKLLGISVKSGTDETYIPLGPEHDDPDLLNTGPGNDEELEYADFYKFWDESWEDEDDEKTADLEVDVI